MSFEDLLFLGVDSCFLAIVYFIYRNKKRTLDAIKAAPVLEIDNALTDKLSSTATKCLPYAVVRGTVRSIGQPIVSRNASKVTGVFQRTALREHQVKWNWVARMWVEGTRDVSTSVNHVPFVLVGNSPKCGGVEVVDHLQATGLELVTVYDSFKPNKLTAVEAVGTFFFGERSKGFQDIEWMLPEGTMLTGIGSLTLNNDRSSRIVLRPPIDGRLPFFLTTESEQSIAEQLNSDKDFFKVLVLVFGVIGGFLLARILVRRARDFATQMQRKDEMKRLAEVRLKRLRDTRTAAQDESTLCRVCYLNPREVLILECGHVCCCVDCALALKPAICPICRSPVERLVPAYNP